VYHHLSPTIKKYVFDLFFNSKLIEHCKDLFYLYVAKGGMTNCISFEKS